MQLSLTIHVWNQHPTSRAWYESMPRCAHVRSRPQRTMCCNTPKCCSGPQKSLHLEATKSPFTYACAFKSCILTRILLYFHVYWASQRPPGRARAPLRPVPVEAPIRSRSVCQSNAEISIISLPLHHLCIMLLKRFKGFHRTPSLYSVHAEQPRAGAIGVCP